MICACVTGRRDCLHLWEEKDYLKLISVCGTRTLRVAHLLLANRDQRKISNHSRRNTRA